MSFAGFKKQVFTPRNRGIFHTIAWIGTSLLALAALILPISARPSSYILAPGDVAPQDIQAPYSLSYHSELLTEQARSEAEQGIQPVYLSADPAISRKQIERLRTTLNYISVVRFDAYATNEQKLKDLSRLTDIELLPEDATFLLALNEVRWEAVQRESLSVLEQVMRDTIRDNQVGDGVRRIPTLISFAIPQDQAAIISNLITPFITANSLFEKGQTEQARNAAGLAVKPVVKNFITGEIIVRRGQVITGLVWEALQQYGLIRPLTSTQDYISAAAIVAAISGFTGLFFKRRHHAVLDYFRTDALLAFLFLFFLFTARLIIPNRAVIPYLFPLPAFGLTIAVLFNLELGLVLSLVLSILTGFGLTNSLDLTVFYIISSMVGILVLGKGQRISTFLWAGIGIGFAGGAVLLSYRLINPYTDLIGLATLVGAAFFCGIASAGLSLLFQYLLSQLLGIPTALQLLEISRPDHPLLQFILQNAPGSYQHSLQVSVLAEQAAEKIGADSMLVRVGGLYHDAGKALNPSYFIENQAGANLNTHDDLDPAESAKTIIEHVTNGVLLARKHRIPSRIQDFIREHHGTMLTRYQYTRAVQQAGNSIELVDKSQFRYPGPIPGSRETALLMLADGCHARVRAELPQTEDDIRTVVRKVIDFCEKEGQLDNTRLTLKDLSVITNSFVDTLKNTYHPRIRYPEISPATQPHADSTGTTK
jgi:putative nucleotidyltransferase with HDIG domain